MIDPSLHQVYIANQEERVVAPCSHFQEVDHTTSACAVTAILPRMQPPMFSWSSSREGDRQVSGKGKQPSPYHRSPPPICYSWNTGNCRFPGSCSYAHVCGNCYGNHPSLTCNDRGHVNPPSKASPSQLLRDSRRE